MHKYCAKCGKAAKEVIFESVEFPNGVFCSTECLNDALKWKREQKDSINPSHYKSHPSGIECIQITEHMGFTLGNCLKYIWRADLKHNDGGVGDLKKALWYLNRELDKRQSQQQKQSISV